MNVSKPLISKATDPMTGFGNDVDTDAKNVPRKSRKPLFQRPFIRPKPTTIQRVTSRYPPSAALLRLFRYHRSSAVGMVASVAPSARAPGPSTYQ